MLRLHLHWKPTPPAWNSTRTSGRQERRGRGAEASVPGYARAELSTSALLRIRPGQAGVLAMIRTPTTSKISIVAAGSQLYLTLSVALSPRTCRPPTVAFLRTPGHLVQTMKCSASWRKWARWLCSRGTLRKTLPTSGSDSRRCLNSIGSFQRKHSRRRSAMFTNWSRGSLGFPANAKPVLTWSRLQSCWVKACASICSTTAFRTRSKVCKQPASP
jgi:hypothetical protein